MSTPDTSNDNAAAAERPFLQVVSGNPTDEEVAVLVTVLAGASGGGPTISGSGEPRNEWGRAIDRLRPMWGGPSSFTNLVRF